MRRGSGMIAAKQKFPARHGSWVPWQLLSEGQGAPALRTPGLRNAGADFSFASSDFKALGTFFWPFGPFSNPKPVIRNPCK